MKCLLSKLIPVRMRSTYGVYEDPFVDAPTWRESASWWQWRGRIFRHRAQRLA